MRTIFITCFTGLVSRNILATDAFALLARRPDLLLVILAPERRAGILRREFGGPKVIVEAVPSRPPTGRERILWILATNLLATRTRRVQRLSKLGRDWNILDYAFSGTAGFLGRFRFVRRLFRALSSRWGQAREFEPLFERYRPALVFATDVYAPSDAALMRLARRRGVKIIGMVRSWDNPTSKTILALVPDFLAVNTDRIEEEMMRYGDVPPDRIAVVGIPHYDRYRDPADRTPRSEFCRALGLDPAKKIILFAPPSDAYLRHDPVVPVVLESLAAVPGQVLVRLPIVGKSELGGYRPAGNVVFDAPANAPDFTEAHLSREADRHLADTLFHADAVITWASTMIVDACFFGKPVVLVGFDAASRPYARSIRQYYDYDHQRRILALGGVRLSRTPAELARWVRAYLEDPSTDAAGRERIRREYCGPLDGRSGQRLADFIRSSLP